MWIIWYSTIPDLSKQQSQIWFKLTHAVSAWKRFLQASLPLMLYFKPGFNSSFPRPVFPKDVNSSYDSLVWSQPLLGHSSDLIYNVLFLTNYFNDAVLSLQGEKVQEIRSKPSGSLLFLESDQVVLVIKNLLTNAGDVKDVGSIRWGREDP